MSELPNVTIVIRSVNERTEEVCSKLAQAQGVPPSDIYVIHETPFHRAVSKAYKIGIESRKQWLICLDGDVLLRPGAVATMIAFADRQKRHIFEIHPFVIDKFFGGPRPGGIHLYRIAVLEQALDFVPEEAGVQRPEGTTLRRMAEIGYAHMAMPYIIGFHDFEQWNKDIFRKCMIHGVKHLDYVRLMVENYRNSPADSDFELAVLAIAEGLKSSAVLSIDAGQDVYKSMFQSSGWPEKSELPAAEWSTETIEAMIEKWQDTPAYRKYNPDRLGLNGGHMQARLRALIKERGMLKGTRLAMGSFMIKAGNRLLRGGT